MLFRYELRRFRRGLPLLALLFIFLVPAIYGALYLSANWDPYGACLLYTSPSPRD